MNRIAIFQRLIFPPPLFRIIIFPQSRTGIFYRFLKPVQTWRSLMQRKLDFSRLMESFGALKRLTSRSPLSFYSSISNSACFHFSPFPLPIFSFPFSLSFFPFPFSFIFSPKPNESSYFCPSGGETEKYTFCIWKFIIFNCGFYLMLQKQLKKLSVLFTFRETVVNWACNR